MMILKCNLRTVSRKACFGRQFHATGRSGKGILDKINPFSNGPSSAAAAKACPPVCNCDDVVSVGGVKIPMYGFGTWQLLKPNVEGSIEYAVETGIRHFDTSITFKNLEDIGEALEKLYKCGLICREDIFISGKLPFYEMKPEKVNGVVQKYLGHLKTDYLDLFMIHYPVGVDMEKGCSETYHVDLNTDHCAIWKAMEELVGGGCVRSLGLSNFKICQIERILKCAKIKPANLQIELHVYNQECDLVKFACCHGISVTAYAPLGSQHLQNHLFDISSTNNNVGNPLTDPAIERISRKHRKTAANVMLRFLLQKGIIVIPKSEKPDRICSNFNVFDFELDGCDMEELEALDKGKYGKMFDCNVWPKTDMHPEYPFWKT